MYEKSSAFEFMMLFSLDCLLENKLFAKYPLKN